MKTVTLTLQYEVPDDATRAEVLATFEGATVAGAALLQRVEVVPVRIWREPVQDAGDGATRTRSIDAQLVGRSVEVSE